MCALSHLYSTNTPGNINGYGAQREFRSFIVILRVLVLHSPDTKTRHVHKPFLKEIFLLNPMIANCFNGKTETETPVLTKRRFKQILICKVEAHFIFFHQDNLETKQNISIVFSSRFIIFSKIIMTIVMTMTLHSSAFNLF